VNRREAEAERPMPTCLQVCGHGALSGGGYRIEAFQRLAYMNGSLLTADEVAEYLQVKRSWVYAATRANRIPHVRLGRYVRYRQDAVEQWIGEKAAGHGERRG
jgi:excisionase family DNA binding protein